MNEFAARKLGEVKAFITSSGDLLGRSREALERAMSTAEIERMVQTVAEQKREVEKIIEDSGQRDIIDTKAEATLAKLESMAGVYMKNESDWQDPSEVLEWLGFFEGGAIVHFHLAAKAGAGLGLMEIASFAEAGAEFHENILEDVTSAIGRLAEGRVQQS